MANINGATITSTASSPTVSYYVTSSTSRASNSSVNVTFKVKAKLGSSGSYLGTGIKLNVRFTVGGTTKSIVVKSNDDSWSGNSWQPEKTLNFGAVSSSSPGNINISFEADRDGSNVSGSAGTINPTTYQLTMPPLLTTVCGTPSAFTVSPSIFETDISLAWSGASGGTNNAISGYELQYCTSADGSSYGVWSALQTVTTTATSGSASEDALSAISRGYYVKFRVRTRGSAGSTYYSGWKESAAIRRNLAPSMPAAVAVSPAPFETSVTINISPSADADGNFSGYELQYCTSQDGVTYGGWTDLIAITTAIYVYSPGIEDGSYIKYRVRAIDTLGAASAWQESASVQRDDGAGFKITLGGAVYKAKAFVSVGGAVYKAKPYLSVSGTVYKGKS